MVALRLALGVLQGGIYTAGFALLTKWLPLREKSTGYSFIHIGGQVGSVFASLITGYMSQYGFAGGWVSKPLTTKTVSNTSKPLKN